ncbi:MAG TPA: hypothetical protein EYG34_07375 [Acidimicrobiia bacterium]|jgi:hypothetical protein|nr:hypothetical protein [Acidimicrobiia bacterium]HIL46917.1 hypothetical protein [Acidimicrobiia bacterium]
MGQPITVVEKLSSRPGIARFEINRSLTGMGHERYQAGQEILGQNPSDELARRLFAHAEFAGLHLNANMITIDLGSATTAGVADIITDLHRFYVEGVEVPSDEELTNQAS